MADELVQAAGICGGAWWNIPAKGWYSGGLPSPCSAALGVDMGGSGWLMSEIADVKGTNSIYCEESDSVTDSSVVFPAAESKKPPRPPHQTPDTGGSCSGGSGGLMVDSALQIMGFGLFPSSSSTDWNQQTLLGSDLGAETNYNSLLHEDLDSRLNYGQAANNGMINNSFSSSIVDHHQVYTIDQQPLNSGSSSGNSATTCEGSGGLPPVSFPLSPTTSYALIQSLLEPDDLQPQVSLFGDGQTLSYSSYPNTYQMNVKNTNSWDRVSPLALDQPNNSLPEEQININNNYINTSLMSNTSLINNIPAGLLNPSSLCQSTARGFDERSSCSCPDTKGNAENIQDSRSVIRKSNGEPTSKKPRLETPSPLPTFKVRKEKLGDRITALQQLVSPFGKTDTASVLHEAIEYIKFLHDQVCILSTPYLTSGDSSVQHHQACQPNNEGPKQDLRSRGLCLVPISVTFPVAHETPVDFWTPTLGGTFR